MDRHLEASHTALEQGVRLTPDEKLRILRARTQALAREPKPEESAGGLVDVVEFTLAHETYGVELGYVREVSPLKELTPLPCTPAFVRGIVNIRGQILSIIDLKKFFDLPEKGLTDLSKVIVLHNHTMVFGILADTIVSVRSILLDSIQAALPTLTGIRAAYLKGVSSERLVMLDGAKLLNDHTLIVFEEVEEDTP